MRARQKYGVCLMGLLVVAHAADLKEEEWYGAKSLKGSFQVYGGTLSEMLPPSAKDRKVSLRFTGLLAKDLFNQIGPDVEKADSCSSATDFPERRMVDVACVYTQADGYICYFDINVPAGNSTYGVIC